MTLSPLAWLEEKGSSDSFWPGTKIRRLTGGTLPKAVLRSDQSWLKLRRIDMKDSKARELSKSGTRPMLVDETTLQTGPFEPVSS